MFYSFVHLSINGHGSVASWRSSRADVFFWSPEMVFGKTVIDRSMTLSVKVHHWTWCLEKLSLIDQ